VQPDLSEAKLKHLLIAYILFLSHFSA